MGQSTQIIFFAESHTNLDKLRMTNVASFAIKLNLFFSGINRRKINRGLVSHKQTVL